MNFFHIIRKCFRHFGALHWLHWAVILLSLLLTLSASYISYTQINYKRQSMFTHEANRTVELVQERMQKYEDALWAGVALIHEHHDQVTFQQWQRYVSHLNLIQKYPGINGIGIIHHIKPNQLQSYLQYQWQQRPDYTVHPRHHRPVYLPISYIIPVKGNERAVGLDMAHEHNRYQAAINAMRSGKPQITAPITLVQDKKQTPGFLLFVPFYENRNNQTLMEREHYFLGMVYAPFIMEKLIDGVLSKQKRHIMIKISDKNITLYNELSKVNQQHLQFSKTKKITMYGRQWTFNIVAQPSFSHLQSNAQPITILITGLVIDLLLIILFLTLTRTTRKAKKFADQATAELQKQTKVLAKNNEQLKETQKELESLVHFDSLTGLPNRTHFLDFLQHAISRCERTNQSIAVCFIDLDNFKMLNDSLGHYCGDELLVKLPKLFAPTMRKVDFLARLSGDEFGLILEQVNSPEEAADIINRYINALNKPIPLGDIEYKITMSVGISMYPGSGHTVDELIKYADIAMYSAKNSGKNTFRFFDTSTNQKIQRRHQIDVALQSAIANNEFSLVYQPQFTTDAGHICGVEALIRWHSNTLGHVPPDEFISVAESNGSIDIIGLWVLTQVAEDYKQLQSLRNNAKVSINISVRQLETQEFFNQVSKLINDYQLPTHLFTFEVTETAAMRDPETLLKRMDQLKNLGISFALDDFGMGYSSMSYLKRMPINYIKIDKSFVRDIDTDQTDAAIVKTIISLAKSLSTHTVAEGVETLAQYQYLQRNQCDFVQGYYFSKPISLTELIKHYGCGH